MAKLSELLSFANFRSTPALRDPVCANSKVLPLNKNRSASAMWATCSYELPSQEGAFNLNTANSCTSLHMKSLDVIQYDVVDYWLLLTTRLNLLLIANCGL